MGQGIPGEHDHRREEHRAHGDAGRERIEGLDPSPQAAERRGDQVEGQIPEDDRGHSRQTPPIAAFRPRATTPLAYCAM